MWVADYIIEALNHMESAFPLEGPEVKGQPVYSKPCPHNKISGHQDSKDYVDWHIPCYCLM